MEEIILKKDFIKLGQVIKAMGMVDSGLEAKIAVQNGLVKVNGIVEYQRGKKLYPGAYIEFNGVQVKIVK